MKFYYVYVLRSRIDTNRHYVDLSDDLVERLNKHNAGQCKYTSKFRPWQIETAIVFQSKEKAVAFEKYLKSHSGRAFGRRHL